MEVDAVGPQFGRFAGLSTRVRLAVGERLWGLAFAVFVDQSTGLSASRVLSGDCCDPNDWGDQTSNLGYSTLPKEGLLLSRRRVGTYQSN